MDWVKPDFSREEVNRAGAALLKYPSWEIDFQNALQIVNNWRASHAYPVNTFQATLRSRAKRFDHTAIFAQRIKRLPSIAAKLSLREKMKLTQMQDIGGCRAILSDIKATLALTDTYESSRFDHTYAGKRDYIAEPKSSGYRGIHLIYRYRGRNRTPHYDDLKVEIQLRSLLQHSWATAVETVGIFTDQALKSSEGDAAWLRFFALASSVIAELEGTAWPPGVPTLAEERDAELKELSKKLNVVQLLKTYQTTLRDINQQTVKDAKFFLLTIEPNEQRIAAKGFLTRDSLTANAKYNEAEQQMAGKKGAQVVLVKVSSMSALRRAYPNYFADTAMFLEVLDDRI